MDSGAWDGSAAADDHESLSSTNDAELLKRAWRTEKAAPEILQFEAGLVQRSREQIQLVEGNVEDLVASGSDPLIVSLNQMDMDRTLYLLRSYLRTRLQKIEKYMFHIHKNTELWNRLSEQEQKFAQRCIEDLEDHFDKSVLSKLPDRYKSSVKQSVISEEDDMGNAFILHKLIPRTSAGHVCNLSNQGILGSSPA
ncbi:DNA replication complex GINS protein SLD5 isoform X2 [Rhododendron vialii]|uniref:DNA replication complex GINS protein SLD5 isoform X2 n=1 Tax=Rhododendron vialii TaxID=182163 RepID=UPI00265E1047|nr:DNA replication complex GINS protein SLD5 isoform X2 [Rhododendron vialii]